MRKLLLSAGLAVFLVANPAWQMAASACEGAEIIFEDKFADDAGGWPLRDTNEVKDGSFVFKLPPDGCSLAFMSAVPSGGSAGDVPTVWAACARIASIPPRKSDCRKYGSPASSMRLKAEGAIRVPFPK